MPMGRNSCNCSNKMNHQSQQRPETLFAVEEGVKSRFDGRYCAQLGFMSV